MTTWEIKGDKANAKKVTALQFDYWLVFDKDGTMKMTRNRPAASRYQRLMFMQSTLPLSLWAAPELKASVTVGEASEATVVDVKAASEALKAVLGVDVDVRVVAAPEPSE